jgi:hypothetical protein
MIIKKIRMIDKDFKLTGLGLVLFSLMFFITEKYITTEAILLWIK